MYLAAAILLSLFIFSGDLLACRQTRLNWSKKNIEFILQDLVKSYNLPGGGGISSIKEIKTAVYEVRLPQEKRVDVMTYHLTSDTQCRVSLVKKSSASKSQP